MYYIYKIVAGDKVMKRASSTSCISPPISKIDRPEKLLEKKVQSLAKQVKILTKELKDLRQSFLFCRRTKY